MPHARHDQKYLKYSASRSISRVACSSVRASLRFSKKTCGVLLWSCGVCRSFKALSSRTAFHRLFCAKPLMAELVPTSSAKMSGVSIVYLAQVDTIRRSIHLAVFSRASWFTLVRLSIVCLSFYLIWCTHCRPLARSLGSRFFHMMLPGSTTYGEATQNHPDTLSSNHHYSHYRSLQYILHSFAFICIHKIHKIHKIRKRWRIAILAILAILLPNPTSIWASQQSSPIPSKLYFVSRVQSIDLSIHLLLQ